MIFSKKVVFTGLLAICLAFTLQAQRGGGGFGDRNSSPEERAATQTDRMIEALDLSAAQGKKIKEVNLEFNNKFDKMRAEIRESGDREGMREAMSTIREEHNTAINKFLTAEQSEKWTQVQEEQNARRESFRKNRQKDGKGKGKGNRKGKTGEKKKGKSSSLKS